MAIFRVLALGCPTVTRHICSTHLQQLRRPMLLHQIHRLACIASKDLNMVQHNVGMSVLHNSVGVRHYAKKAKKENVKKVSKSKVELNQEELNSIIDYDKFLRQLEQTLEELKDSYIKQLTLRTSSAAFDHLAIHTEDGKYPLIQLAQIVQKTPQLLVINMSSSPQYISAVKEAIEKSGMNVNPQQDGTTLFVPVPKVTREHRENLAKAAKTLCDRTKEKLREVQNRFLRDIKKKQTEHSEDLVHALLEQVQTTSHSYASKAEILLEAKKNELLA